MDANNVNKKIANINDMPRAALQEALNSAKKTRLIVRSKLAKGEQIVIPKRIADALEEAEKAS